MRTAPQIAGKFSPVIVQAVVVVTWLLSAAVAGGDDVDPLGSQPNGQRPTVARASRSATPRTPRNRTTTAVGSARPRSVAYENRLRAANESVYVEPPTDEPSYGTSPDVPLIASRPGKVERWNESSEANVQVSEEQRSAPNYEKNAPSSAAVLPAVLRESSPEAEPAPTDLEPEGSGSSLPDAAQSPLPLRSRRAAAKPDRGEAGSAGPRRFLPGIGGAGATVLASLALVLGLFFLFTWFVRRGMPGGIPTLPREVIEVMGRVQMPSRQQMQLIRCGNKLLLVHLSLTGAETLTEITDPEEIDRIAGLCQQLRGNSATRNFNEVLSELGRERPTRLAEQDYGLELGGGRSMRHRGRRNLDA